MPGQSVEANLRKSCLPSPKTPDGLWGRQIFLFRQRRASFKGGRSRRFRDSILSLYWLRVCIRVGFGVVSEGAKVAAPPLTHPAILRFALAGWWGERRRGSLRRGACFGRLRRADGFIASRRCVCCLSRMLVYLHPVRPSRVNRVRAS